MPEKDDAVAFKAETSSLTQSGVSTDEQVPSSDSAFLVPAEAMPVKAITQPV